jgi:hypothetical protein
MAKRVIKKFVRDLERVAQLDKLSDDTLVSVEDFAHKACLTPSFIFLDTTHPKRGGKLAAMGVHVVKVGRKSLLRLGDHKKIGAIEVEPERALEAAE